MAEKLPAELMAKQLESGCHAKIISKGFDMICLGVSLRPRQRDGR